MFYIRVVSALVISVLIGCSSSNSDGQLPTSDNQVNDTGQSQEAVASCDSVDISIFCVSINGAEETLYVLMEDSASPLLYNPFMTTRFDTASGITLAEVRFDITSTSFIKAASVIFSGNTPGSYVMDGSGNFAGYTLAANQSWTFIDGFSTGGYRNYTLWSCW